MQIERTKNALRNTRWGLLQKSVHIIFPFIIRTVLIYTLNAEYAGLSSLFTSILSVLSLTELGFAHAIVYSMYRPIAEDDQERICALLNFYRKAYWVIGTIILTCGIALIPVLPHLIKGDVPENINLYIVYLVYLLNNAISYFMYGYKVSLLSAYQREDIISRNILISNLILYGVQIIVLFMFRDYYVYAFVIPVTTILMNLLNNHAANVCFPHLKPFGNIDNEDLKAIKKNVIGLMLSKIGVASRNSFDSIVVSMYLGLTVVAMYNNYYLVINGLNAFLGVLITSITAGVGNKIAVETPERNYEDYKKFQFYYMFFSGFCTVCMMCLYQPFMRIWMGNELVFPEYIMFIFCYYFMMMKQGDINSVYYSAAGLWWHGKFKSIIEAVLNLTLNVILGKYFGVAGIVMATIISFTCIYFYGSKFTFTKYFKNGKLKRFYIDNAVYLLVTALVGSAIYYMLNHTKLYGDMTIMGFLVLAIVCSVLAFILLTVVYGLDKEKRGYYKMAIKYLKYFITKTKSR